MSSGYQQYLQKKGYSLGTVTSYLTGAAYFLQWSEEQGYDINLLAYKDVMAYIKYLQQRGNSKRTINHRLGILRLYFDYQIEQGERLINPALDVQVKGMKRKLLYNLLKSDELEDLYYSYPSKGIKDARHALAAVRNKVVVGLMVYQGLSTTCLQSLKIEHVQMEQGRIYVPSTRKTNSRSLELKSWQMIELMNYVQIVRPQILAMSKVETEELFISLEGKMRMSGMVVKIMQRLKKINQKVENNRQIRASVISNWLKQYHLRKVQKMAGHRYISSTERYQQNDLENMQEAVNKYHPIS